MPPNLQVFGGKRAPDDHFAQFSAFGPEKRRIPAEHVTACHRLYRLSPFFFWGRKVRKRLGKAKSESVLGPGRSRIGPGAGLVRPGAGLVGPGAGLVRAWCGALVAGPLSKERAP